MALIQVLAWADGTIRSESGLTTELQGKPTSKGAPTWVALAQNHREFFRVHTDPMDQTQRVALISRHVLQKNTQSKRPALPSDVSMKLLELAISLYDREVARKQRFRHLVSIIATILVALLTGIFLLATTWLQILYHVESK